ncbi:hypothetical protein [Vibrio sp. WZ-1]|uniref:hypothetical protein n=1 Tax=Vibrio sp. WZ-1 TaxID=3454501 RepID=UPI003F825830
MKQEYFTINQLTEAVLDSSKVELTSDEKSSLIVFREFLIASRTQDILLSKFGEFNFLEFNHYLSLSKPSKRRYVISTTVRRLFEKANSILNCFTRCPSSWPTPPKPKPSHFEPLSTEQLDTLRSFLKKQIDLAYQKESIASVAIKTGVPSTRTGLEFWRKDNQDNNLPRFKNWTSNLVDTLATFYSAHPEYPNNVTREMQKTGGKYYVPRDLTYTNLNNPIVTIMKRIVMQNVKSYTPFIPNEPGLNNKEILSYLYPDFREMIAIKTAICLETGWSPDITDKINPYDFTFDPIPIESDWVFIKSTKAKGAALNKNSRIREQREMIHPSSKKNRYSAYNLIKLLVKRTSRLRQGHLYSKAISDINAPPAFVSFTTNTKVQIVASHPARGEVNRQAAQKYLANELGFNLDLRQLRPTRLYLNETENNLPLLLQVILFGHSTSAITDGIYKDNAHFNQIRKDKLSCELDSIAESISDGSFKGTLIPLRTHRSIQKKILTIYSNQCGESPLAICNDPTRPDWKVTHGKIKTPCRQFNKCLLCSQSSVTSNNIPFIVDRYLYLDQIRRTSRDSHFESIHGDEFKAAKEVIDCWPYKEEIEEAELRSASEGYLLPPIISENYT